MESAEVKPSVFEVVSHQGFAHALRPAIQHVVKVLAERYPEWGVIVRIFRNFDEFYLALDSLVQYHYILTRGATLSEAFYGLERRYASGSKTRLKVGYILSVLLPYLKVKMDRWWEAEKERRDFQATMPTRNQRPVGAVQEKPVRGTKISNLASLNGAANEALVCEKVDVSVNGNLKAWIPTLWRAYPYLKTLLDLANFICLMRYTFLEKKRAHNLLSLLAGMRLTYMSAERARFVDEKRTELFSLREWSLRRLPVMLLRLIGEGALFGVEMGSFFFQFLEWWYNDPRRARVTLGTLPVPPPLSEEDQAHVKFTEEEKGLCPLCRRKFRNPTALGTSGIVYCYGCISPYIKQHGKCPLTSVPSRIDHLIRIFA